MMTDEELGRAYLESIGGEITTIGQPTLKLYPTLHYKLIEAIRFCQCCDPPRHDFSSIRAGYEYVGRIVKRECIFVSKIKKEEFSDCLN